jgi:hypothetical protein
LTPACSALLAAGPAATQEAVSASNETDVLDLLESILEGTAEPLAEWGEGEEGEDARSAAAAPPGSFRHYVWIYMRGQLAVALHCLQAVHQLQAALQGGGQE